MKGYRLLGIGILLVTFVVVATVVFPRRGEVSEESDRVRSEERLQGKSESGRGGRVESWTPETADAKLRELVEGAGGKGWSFAEVSAMARALSGEDLRALVEEVGLGRTDGMLGWVRAALFAEWGKRDFAEAMSWLSEHAGSDSAHQQALYAVFRGSRPDDPTAALRHLETMFEKHPAAVGAFTRSWARKALREVFGGLARSDPAGAWRSLNAGEESDARRDVLTNLSRKISRQRSGTTDDARWAAMAGFFEGLPSLREAQKYAQEFEAEWNAPSTVEALNRFAEFRKRSPRLGRLGYFGTGPPPQEGAGSSIASALAAHDPEAGLAWLVAAGPEWEGSGRVQVMWNEWAKGHPAEAFEVMRSGGHTNWHGTIASALLRADARLGIPLAQEFGDAKWFSQAFSNSFPVAATMMDDDLFPRPIAGTILPDHEARYASFLEALEVSPLAGREIESVRSQLADAFRHTVEKARLASRHSRPD